MSTPRTLATLVALSMLATLVGCSGGGGGGGATQNAGTSNAVNIDVSQSPEDRMILVAETPDGAKVAYYGEKDAEGIPQSVDAIIHTSSAGLVTQVLYDDQGRPVTVISDNGDSYTLEWISATEVAVTATTADEETTVTVVIDPTTGEEVVGKSRADFVVASKPQLWVPPVTLAPVTRSRASQTIRVNVYKGGQPYDPEVPTWIRQPTVTLELLSSSTSYNHEYTAKRIGKGVYVATIPTKSQTLIPEKLKQIINGFSQRLSITCDFFSYNPPHPLLGTAICTSISTAVLGIPGVQAGAGAVFGVCNGTWAAYNIYCDALTVGQAGKPLTDFLYERIRGQVKTPASKGMKVQLRPNAISYNQYTNSTRYLAGNSALVTVSDDGTIALPKSLRVELESDRPRPPGSESDEEGGGTEDGDPPAPPKPRAAIRTSPRPPRVGSLYSVIGNFTGIPAGGRVYLSHRKRRGGEVKGVGANYAQLGSDGAGQLKITRTLGAANAHYALAVIYDQSGKLVARTTLNY